jgi:hypothetical protein
LVFLLRREPKTEARRRREITQVAKQQVRQPSKAGNSSTAQAEDGKPAERGSGIGG